MRDLSETDAKSLKPGSDHYTAYVGPPGQYDFMGATQFALLFALGLREHHKVLDFGCGSLRAGRLLIPYLNPGCYFGIEPNRWLVDEAIKNQIGADIVSIKRPTFSQSDAYSAEVFGETFDFIVAQSIFSHAGPDIVRTALASFARALAGNGLCVVTFIEGDNDTPPGWHYPGVISFRRALIEDLMKEAGFAARSIPWYHPRQQWWLLARDPATLPSDDECRWLRGIVLRAPEFGKSIPAA
ncbi:MAG: class I SAM-dependent methyltransferase [Pseudolabrys sp.]|jgi:SAM-dependent methyltransferase